MAVLFALLNGEHEYGATLHEVDAGIDTGRVLAEHRFRSPPTPATSRSCSAVCAPARPVRGDPAGDRRGQAPPAPARPAGPPAYYGTRALTRLAAHRDHPAYPAATDLGPFATHAPELAAAISPEPTMDPTSLPPGPIDPQNRTPP